MTVKKGEEIDNMTTKIINWFALLVMILIFFLITPVLVKAADITVKLPDGQEIPVGSLTSMERKDLLNIMDKINKAKNDSTITTGEVISFANNPEKIDAWRKVITGTIKDVCNDLNVTVNDFIKTPVGMGVAGLIIYKVIGKDFLRTFVDVILVIPAWFICMTILLFLRHKYFGVKVIYRKKVKTGVDNKGKPIYTYSDPKTELIYPWDSDDARTVVAVALTGCAIAVTMAAFIVIF